MKNLKLSVIAVAAILVVGSAVAYMRVSSQSNEILSKINAISKSVDPNIKTSNIINKGLLSSNGTYSISVADSPDIITIKYKVSHGLQSLFSGSYPIEANVELGSMFNRYLKVSSPLNTLITYKGSYQSNGNWELFGKFNEPEIKMNGRDTVQFIDSSNKLRFDNKTQVFTSDFNSKEISNKKLQVTLNNISSNLIFDTKEKINGAFNFHIEKADIFQNKLEKIKLVNISDDKNNAVNTSVQLSIGKINSNAMGPFSNQDTNFDFKIEFNGFNKPIFQQIINQTQMKKKEEAFKILELSTDLVDKGFQTKLSKFSFGTANDNFNVDFLVDFKPKKNDENFLQRTEITTNISASGDKMMALITENGTDDLPKSAITPDNKLSLNLHYKDEVATINGEENEEVSEILNQYVSEYEASFEMIQSLANAYK